MATRQGEEAEKESRVREMRGVFSGVLKVVVDITPPSAVALVGLPWLAAATAQLQASLSGQDCEAIVDGAKRLF